MSNMKRLFVRLFIISVGIILFFSSCKQNSGETKKPPVDPMQYNENLQEANRIMAESEEIQIDDYVSRIGWKMRKTPTGLRYWIYELGEGRKTEELTSRLYDSIYQVYSD